MVINKDKFYIFSIFIILFSNLFPKFNAEEIKWEKIQNKKSSEKNNKIKWKKYFPKTVFEKSENEVLENKIKEYSDSENIKETKEFFYLGFAVPNADLLTKKDFMIYAEQLFPLYKSDLEQGTANQNYSVFIGYGINDKMMLTGFFSHSDDPLYSKINNIEKQPANKWISLGIGSRLNLFESSNFLLSLDTSLESWYVKSGGCNGIGCNVTSSNIFDKSLNEFKNLNLIGSLALPSTFRISEKTKLVFSPKITFLPKNQTFENSSGSFYGLNTGIGLGLSKELNKRLHIYNSAYFPLSGNNTFDNNLKYKKAIIYDFGFSYLIDPKVSFQGYLSNSFGATPATGVLTIPSDNNLILGTRLVYKPTALDVEENLEANFKYKFDGLSVTNTDLIKPNELLFDISFDKYSGIWTKVSTGLSRNFNFEIITGKSSSKKMHNNYFDNYIGSNLQTLRFGGKAILIKQNKSSPITSGVRMTFGRTLGDNWPGYLFLENINSKNFSSKIKLNITPKIAWTSSENLAAIGTSLIFDLNDKFSLIFERNTALRNAESNFTTAFRILNNENRYIDFYVTDSSNFNDIGELINAKDIYYGIKVGFKF